jgi:hypothetical protein
MSRVEKKKKKLVLCICATSHLSDKSERGENGERKNKSIINRYSISLKVV